jgi:hypothetical protein
MNDARDDHMTPDTITPLYETLQRYAGWLDRERQSVMVRNDVMAIGVAIDTGMNPASLLLTLDADLAKLPSGEVRKMLRAASAKMTIALRLKRSAEDTPDRCSPRADE